MLLERTMIATLASVGLIWSTSSLWAQEKRDAQSLELKLLQQDEKVKRLRDELRDKLKKSGDPLSEIRSGEEGFRALYTMNRDGSNVKFLVAAPGMISSATPDWSHDGRYIAFDCVPTLQAFTQSRIFIYAVSGPFKGAMRDLGYGNVPSWSPDDRQIAYMVNDSNPDDLEGGIWIMDADGSNKNWLCRGWYPRWSPDGKQICCHAFFDDPPGLHLVDVKSQKSRQLFGERVGVKFGGATWSPDSNRVVFIALFDGKEHLAIADIDEGPNSLKVLYREDRENRSLVGPPSWSPDGKQIVFAIQDEDAAGPKRRQWHHTYLCSISAEVPSAPVRLEKKETGLINRGMMWSPDSRKIVFSSER